MPTHIILVVVGLVPLSASNLTAVHRSRPVRQYALQSPVSSCRQQTALAHPVLMMVPEYQPKSSCGWRIATPSGAMLPSYDLPASEDDFGLG